MTIPERQRLPDTRHSITRKVDLGTGDSLLETYFTVGFDGDGVPREIFATCNRQGDMVRGLLDGWCIMVSIALQHDIPLQQIHDKFRGQKFGPSGFTGQKDLPNVTSILDFAVRWMVQLVERGEGRPPE